MTERQKVYRFCLGVCGVAMVLGGILMEDWALLAVGTFPFLWLLEEPRR